jgi:hypothetical protein
MQIMRLLRRVEMKSYKKIISAVDEIYKWIDQQQSKSEQAGICDACGKCCDFKSFVHRLYVTTPEMIYFSDKLGAQNIKKMTSQRCCYQVKGKCAVYSYRFAGCRIFCCKGDIGFQSELTESAIKKFKAICEKLKIPYRYMELPKALEEAMLSICQSAGKSSAGGRGD